MRGSMIRYKTTCPYCNKVVRYLHTYYDDIKVYGINCYHCGSKIQIKQSDKYQGQAKANGKAKPVNYDKYPDRD